MKPIALSLIFFAAVAGLQAQTYNIRFTATGAVSVIDSVLATNLSTGRSITLPGNETLILTSGTGIDDLPLGLEQGIVFPNPFSGNTRFVLELGDNRPVEISLISLSGQVLDKFTQSIGPGPQEFDLSVPGSGIYFLRVNAGGNTSGYKIFSVAGRGTKSGLEYRGNAASGGSGTLIGLKSGETTYSLRYTRGNLMRYQCMSGNMTTILTDTPTADRTWSVEFTGCIDAELNSYPAVIIGTQTWMAKNLTSLPSVNNSTQESGTAARYYVYGYEGGNVTQAKGTSNFADYGVLYNWEAAKTACPQGWHLPSETEWNTLADYVGDDGGGALKEAGTRHWLSPNYTATNTTGFTGLPGGTRNSDAGFELLTYQGFFWSSTLEDTYPLHMRLLFNGSIVFIGPLDRTTACSVRCLRNAN